MTRATLLLSALLQCWCTDSFAQSCESWGSPSALGTLKQPFVHESSGLARSHLHDGVWYTHNDSGSGPEIHAFRLSGEFLGTSTVTGAESIDWEAMATGPCPGQQEQSCIYIGDIGDNAKKRSSIQIYAIPEPSTLGQPASVLATWNLSYPSKARDAEALLVHPETGALTLITKSGEGKSRIMSIPAQPSSQLQSMTQVARVQIKGMVSNQRKITGGDWSPDGQHIVLRSYTDAMIWTVDSCAPLAHWELPPDRVYVGITIQGEAIAFDGAETLLVTSEGSPMPILSTRCIEWKPPEQRSCPPDP